MDWEDFEEAVAEFFKSKGYQVSRNLGQVGKSGVIHEIDVLASKEHKFIACECKSGNQKPTKHLVAEWESVCRDLPFEVQPAIASESGFTYFGLLYAKGYNIMLISKSQNRLEVIDLSNIKTSCEI